jgi:hypothetical protein
MRRKLVITALAGALLGGAFGQAFAAGHPGPGNSGNCAGPPPVPASCPNH